MLFVVHVKNLLQNDIATVTHMWVKFSKKKVFFANSNLGNIRSLRRGSSIDNKTTPRRKVPRMFVQKCPSIPSRKHV